MGYLGLDATPVKDDHLFQRLFGPSDHAGETDQLGKQGFWVCFAVAVLSSLVLAFQGSWLDAILVLLFYGLGGIGIREHSQPAAVLVASAYTLQLFIALIARGQIPGFIVIAAWLLLVANIRGTWIAAKWARVAADEMPPRDGVGWQAQLVDRMPAIVWPRARIPFFVLAGVYVCLAVLGAVLAGIGRSPLAAAPVKEPVTRTVIIHPSQ